MIRIGYIDTRTKANIKQLDVIKMDVSDDSNSSLHYNKVNSSTIQGYNKCTTTLEFDFLTEALKKDIKNVLMESNHPKVFIRHPSGSNQFLNFYSITKPSITSVVLAVDSELTDLAYGGTEISTTNYSNISNIDTACLDTETAAHAYQYIFLKFKCAFDLSTNYIKRLSLLLHNPYAYDSNLATGMGLKIDYLNQAENVWHECSRLNYTTHDTTLRGLGKYNQHYAVIRPREGFTNFSNIGYADNCVYFRIRNLQERLSYLHVGFNYAELLIDGWPVSLTSEVGLNYRDSFTGTGKTGSITLSEL